MQNKSTLLKNFKNVNFLNTCNHCREKMYAKTFFLNTGITDKMFREISECFVFGR